MTLIFLASSHGAGMLWLQGTTITLAGQPEASPPTFHRATSRCIALLSVNLLPERKKYASGFNSADYAHFICNSGLTNAALDVTRVRQGLLERLHLCPPDIYSPQQATRVLATNFGQWLELTSDNSSNAAV